MSDEDEAGDECPICDKLGCEGHTLVESTYVDSLTAERDQLLETLKELVEALPRCILSRCDRRATFHNYDLDYCDEHADEHADGRCGEHEYAPELRAALALLEGKAGGGG
jgi:hypothetical protein